MTKKENEAESEVESPAPAQSVETIILISAVLTLIEQILPKITALGGGNVSAEQQEAIRARYDALTADMDAAFSGDHWRVRPN